MRAFNIAPGAPQRIAAAVAAGIAAVQVAACAAHIAPPHTTIERPALVRWDAEAFSSEAYNPRWWGQLEDPVLEALENAALGANRDIRSALARLDESRAVFDEDRRRRYPTVTAGAFVDVRQQVTGLHR
jgi:outer membrane protein TolC